LAYVWFEVFFELTESSFLLAFAVIPLNEAYGLCLVPSKVEENFRRGIMAYQEILSKAIDGHVLKGHDGLLGISFRSS
jgi:hypothetical protein